MPASFRSKAKEPHIDIRISLPQTLAARLEFALSNTSGTRRAPPHGAKSALVRQLIERWLASQPDSLSTPSVEDI